MTFYKSILLLMGLSMLAALVACGGGSHTTTTPPPPTITVTLSAFTGPLAVNSQTPITATTTDTAGVKWSVTCATIGACGTFTAAQTTTGTANKYIAPPSPTTNVVITATSVTTNTISASTSPAITITGAILADGNYAFSLAGEDANGNYYVAGVITIAGNGTTITAGEQDFADFLHDLPDAINPTGSSIAYTADGNVLITLVTCTRTCPAVPDPFIGPGGNGIETLNGTILPLSATGRTFITEFDASASGSGELAPQNAVASAATPAGGYAFVLNGYDPHPNGFSEAVGGIINVDGAGTISGTGSIFDVNDGGATSPSQTVGSTSTVSPSDPFGRVTFTLVTTNFSTIVLVGYIVDSSHIQLVETSDAYGGTLGGVAFSQGANNGTFTVATAANTYVVGLTGFDTTPGVLQLVNQLTLTAGPPGTVTGFLDYNDLASSSGLNAASSPDPITAAAYTVDPSGAGDVTIAGIADSSGVSYNLQLYLDGNGHALAISMDANDVIAGAGFTRGAGPFAATSFTGPYALNVTGADGTNESELDGVGPVSATGAGETIAGTVDLNWFLSSGPTYPARAVTGAFATTGVVASNSVFTGTVTGVDAESCIIVGTCSVDTFSYYLIDVTGDNIAIETDENQLTLGFFLQQ